MENMVAASANPNSAFWAGKRVLVTGHTGFKGGWLALWLSRLGAQVTGVALAPSTRPSLFDTASVAVACAHHLCDIRDAAALRAIVAATRPDIVFHLAAQPLVRASYRTPSETFATNVQGTVNLLEALRHDGSVRVIVAITTDKVYRNVEWIYPYREEDALGGHDPYSASKAAAEIAVSSYRDSFFVERGVRVATARAGNVIGGGDWSEDRLVPDAVRAWLAREELVVRNPGATRPWQHVLEPISGYLRLAERMASGPQFDGAWNFGPDPSEAASVYDVVTALQPHFVSNAVAWGTAPAGPKEAGWLAVETAKARHSLGVSPRWNLAEALARTATWYRGHADGVDARNLCDADIEAFERAA